MPNSKKNAPLVQDTNAATLSHETAKFLKTSLQEFFDPQKLGWTAKEINEDLFELLMYAMGNNFFDDSLQRQNLVFTLKKVSNFITDIESVKEHFETI